MAAKAPPRSRRACRCWSGHRRALATLRTPLPPPRHLCVGAARGAMECGTLGTVNTAEGVHAAAGVRARVTVWVTAMKVATAAMATSPANRLTEEVVMMVMGRVSAVALILDCLEWN